MTNANNFELVAELEIAELKTQARLYRHRATGARVLSLENEDENKVFGITFATPPTDSTGLPHIMEHSVLCGSRKYPVKEPFVELLKGSLQTFLNAMTFSDKTCYPVASQNTQDFYNLIDVYLDAVFYPNITPQTLQQEGWHYELDSLDAPLSYKGVVFNEMKGAYSDPENYLYRKIEQSLFPDNTYGVESGGDPAEIPNLTYEQFKRFHDTLYHPSNAFIFFYGDDDPAERLRIIQPYLDGFARQQVDAAIPPQPAFDAPRRLIYGYDAGDEGADAKKTMVAVNWALDEVTDVEATLALSILNHILVGTPASPLRKALIDSGLGEDLVGVGLELDTRQAYFSTGLKGIVLDDAGRVEDLIVTTLTELARPGHRAGDDRGGGQHGRVPTAREQHGLLSAWPALDAAGAASVAAWRRSALGAGLRGAAGGDQAEARRRSCLFRGPDRPALPGQPAPDDGHPPSRSGGQAAA